MKLLGYTIKKAKDKPRLWGDSWFYPVTIGNYVARDRSLVDMYNEIPEVAIPINFIVDSLIDVKLRHVRLLSNGDKQIVENSRPLQVLKSPNQFQRYRNFVRAFLLNRLVLGVGYINRIETTFGVSQVYVLPSAYTKPKLETVDKQDFRLYEVKAYEVNWGNGIIKLKPDEVIVDYETSLRQRDLDFRSRLETAVMLSNSLAANYEARVKSYVDRGALGVLSPRDPLAVVNKDTKDNIESQYYSKHGITGDKMPFMISKIPLDYNQVTFNVADLQLLEIKQQDFMTVCSMFGIDVVLFDNSSSTYNNKVLAQRNFWENVGIPTFNTFAEVLGEVFKLPDNEVFEGMFDDIPALREDKETTTKVISEQYKNGIITRQEARVSLGRDPEGEGDYKNEIEGATGVAQD